jgi:mannosyltransferase OCH1-like enzyme
VNEGQEEGRGRHQKQNEDQAYFEAADSSGSAEIPKIIVQTWDKDAVLHGIDPAPAV